MTTELTSHWRSLYENKYLGAWNLWNATAKRYTTASVTIESARFESVTMQGGRTSKSLLLRFKGKRTPLIVTKTMGKVLEKMCGKTPAEWIGTEITLYVEQGFKTKDGPADVLRIRNTRAGDATKAALRGESAEPEPQEPERFDESEVVGGAQDREPGEEG